MGFLPRWRFDDIMISWSGVGGGVGPHFDYYDVFLFDPDGNLVESFGAGLFIWPHGLDVDDHQYRALPFLALSLLVLLKPCVA